MTPDGILFKKKLNVMNRQFVACTHIIHNTRYLYILYERSLLTAAQPKSEKIPNFARRYDIFMWDSRPSAWVTAFFCVCEASVRRNDVFAACYWGSCLSILWEMISPRPLSRWNIRKNEDRWPSLGAEVTITAARFFLFFGLHAGCCAFRSVFVAAVNHDPSSPRCRAQAG